MKEGLLADAMAEGVFDADPSDEEKENYEAKSASGTMQVDGVDGGARSGARRRTDAVTQDSNWALFSGINDQRRQPP